jgi:hypothetical protein
MDEYLALADGAASFPQSFTGFVVLRILLCCLTIRLRDYHPLWSRFHCVQLSATVNVAVLQPQQDRNLTGLGSSLFARHYLGNHYYFLFLQVLRCFSSPGLLQTAMYLLNDDRSSICRVSPFGNPRINGCLHLPAAYRSLSRPSSPVHAKPSPKCS